MSIFRIVAVDGDDATGLADSDALGAYEFRTRLGTLVPAIDSGVGDKKGAAAVASGSRISGPAQADIVDRIRVEMAHAGINQSTLARLSGVPETTLSKILNSQSVLDVEQAGSIAGAFGLELWELVLPHHALPAVRRILHPRQTLPLRDA